MEGFTDVFEETYPGITLEWVVLPENELRGRVTTDTATGAGSFDVVTVGTFEVPIWGAERLDRVHRRRWLRPIPIAYSRL